MKIILTKEFKTIDSDITFNKVSFQYKSRATKTLDNVSLTIEKGKVTAFVGPSGSGKSTMAKLMMRLYDPDEGSITIGDTPLTDINLREYRHRVGYVGQEPCLFHESIKNNLLNANPKATDTDVEIALKTAMAYNFVNKLEDGIDTDVGAIGGNLSGGQKQRIAIARALINKPDLLVFDEATSALDSENERKVQEAIDKINEESEVTRVVIAHRLSTIQNADKIVMFNEGRIVDEGTHEELMQTNKKYHKEIERFADAIRKVNISDFPCVHIQSFIALKTASFVLFNNTLHQAYFENGLLLLTNIHSLLQNNPKERPYLLELFLEV